MVILLWQIFGTKNIIEVVRNMRRNRIFGIILPPKNFDGASGEKRTHHYEAGADG